MREVFMNDALMERLKTFLYRDGNSSLVGSPAIPLSSIRQDRSSSVTMILGKSSY